MGKEIKIYGAIDVPMIEDISNQLEKIDLKAGDKCDILFDSEGGVIDVAMCIAKVFEELADDGVILRAIAEGKVWSAAIVPYLAISERVAQKEATFLIHKATVEMLDSVVDREILSYTLDELESYTGWLKDYYDSHGIVPTVSDALLRGTEVVVESEGAYIAGFTTEMTALPQNKKVGLRDKIEKAINKFFDPQPVPIPKFAFINKFNTLNNKPMTKTEITAMVNEALKEALPGAIGAVVKAIKGEDPTVSNASEKVTSEELGKSAHLFFKTPAKVTDYDTVKYLIHPTENVVKDHFVIPVTEDGEPVELKAGDHKVEVNGTERIIHSTGKDFYIHEKGTDAEDNKSEAKNEEDDKEEHETIKITKTKEEEEEENCSSRAPRNQSAQLPTKVDALKEMYTQYRDITQGTGVGH